MSVPDNATLAEAKDWLRERVQTGAPCPCCGQNAQVYHRRINKGMLSTLTNIYRSGGSTRWVDVTTLDARNREHNKLAYWGLVEAHPEHRGWWKVTKQGEQFLHGQARVPECVNVYNNRVLGFSQPMVSASDIVEGFDLTELMSQRAPYAPGLE